MSSAREEPSPNRSGPRSLQWNKHVRCVVLRLRSSSCERQQTPEVMRDVPAELPQSAASCLSPPRCCRKWTRPEGEGGGET